MKDLAPKGWLETKRDWRSLLFSLFGSLLVSALVVYFDHAAGELPNYSLDGLIGVAVGRAIVTALLPALLWPFFTSRVVIFALACSAAISFTKYF